MSWSDPSTIVDMVRTLEERGLFDVVVIGDQLAIASKLGNSTDVYVKYGLDGLMFDPMPLAGAIMAATSKIGVVATLNTSLWPPQVLSRAMHTLKQLSQGRTGLNIVTGVTERAKDNFDLAIRGHDASYDFAEAYLTECRNIWRDFEAADHVAVPGVPAGPVIMQAGSSDRGKDFAAANASIVLTHQNTVQSMKAFYDDIKARVRKFGRNEDDCKVFFTTKPIVGLTDEDAEQERRLLASSPEISSEIGLARFSQRIGVDLSGADLDKPLEGDVPGQTRQSTTGRSLSMYQQYYGDDKTRRPPLREVALQEAMKETTGVQGSPETVASRMIELMTEVGGDGFAIRGGLSPRKVSTFVDKVIPELQRRNAVRSAYTGTTLRDHLAQF
ncbi:LLM class flavin-dependent oxidoreductase [Acuticoccus mangrovi]|uniref:LLM class flavin-dependent oxidoreductase n=1 Tax=Acuticoccus mangrovi TaxID=2796142 RepID=A0A934IRU5_9HYPH|nr:LLM class flavin-dependent oxidoreductase [Acuticoccus mangrovi]MBJ3777500.1 LLM class flavin-dependent oxidoreductase [Acuticoccus mangrovi]